MSGLKSAILWCEILPSGMGCLSMDVQSEHEYPVQCDLVWTRMSGLRLCSLSLMPGLQKADSRPKRSLWTWMSSPTASNLDWDVRCEAVWSQCGCLVWVCLSSLRGSVLSEMIKFGMTCLFFCNAGQFALGCLRGAWMADVRKFNLSPGCLVWT